MKKPLLKPDPRAVILSNMAVSLAALSVRSIPVMSAALLCAAVFAGLLGENPFFVFKKLRRFLLLILTAAVLQSIFIRGGRALLYIGDFTLLTRGGVQSGVFILLRMSVLIMTGAAIASCGTRQGIQALIQLRLPYEIAFMVYIAIHFIPVLTQEMGDALTAIQLRGVDIRRIPVRLRLRVYTYLFIPVVSSAVLKARDLSISMELRAFRAYPKRTSLHRLKMKPGDYALTAGFISAAAAAVLYSYGLFQIFS